MKSWVDSSIYRQDYLQSGNHSIRFLKETDQHYPILYQTRGFFIIDYDAVDLFNYCIPNVNLNYYFSEETLSKPHMLNPVGLRRSQDLMHELEQIVVFKKSASTGLTVGHLVNITNKKLILRLVCKKGD